MSSCVFTKRGLKTISDKIYYEDMPSRHINHPVTIEEGVTFRQILNVVAKDPALCTIMSVYSDINNIKDWHDEVNQKYKGDNSLSHIEIVREGLLYKNQFSYWADWFGVRKRKSKNEGKTVSLSYTPLYEVANLPVKLNPKLRIWGLDQTREEKPIIDYVMDYTLIEVLHAIYYDIGFHGGPKDRDKFKGELYATADEAKSLLK